jgi:hypothetical protein
MYKKSILLAFLLSFIITNSVNATTTPIPISDLPNYHSYPTIVKELITSAKSLSQKNLTYQYGSSNPSNHGMDCSGTIHYLLSLKVNDVPRQADEMLSWVETKGKLYHVKNYDISSSDFSHLKAGDLLFWSGTYSTNRRASHVMIYLGKNSEGRPLMFGASNGRRYQGKKMWGVSVFDLEFPRKGSSAKFIGYSCIPNLTCN